MQQTRSFVEQRKDPPRQGRLDPVDYPVLGQ